MDLPKNEAVFDFNHEGLTTGKKYDGQFTVVCILNMARKHALEIEKTRLMADFSNPTETLFGLSTILGNLRVRIVNAPEWWKQSNGGFNLMDEDVLIALYDKVMDAEAKWREALKGQAKAMGSPETTTPAES